MSWQFRLQLTPDLIHVKSMLMEVPSYADMVRNLTRLLKPRGLLVLVEAELSFVSFYRCC